MNKLLEICCTSFASAKNAQLGGADRIELCVNLSEGGTTPSLGLLQKIKSELTIPVFVLIRPREGDFCYSQDEIDVIERDITLCKNIGADGIVSGALNTDGTIHKKVTEQLVKLSHPLPFTFHRAFDLVPDLSAALQTLIELGVTRVLTSGGKQDVISGAAILANLNQQAQGRIGIIAGSGLNSKNLDILLDSGCTEFHTSAKIWRRSSMIVPPNINFNGFRNNLRDDYLISSLDEIKALRMLLN